MKPLSKITAKHIWTQFLKKQKGIIPFAYNPDLLEFYRDYFSWEPYYIIIRKAGEVIGLFPLIYTGKAWTSLPHFSYGGILWNNHVDVEEDVVVQRCIMTCKAVEGGYYEVNLEDLESINSSLNEKYFLRSNSTTQTEGLRETEKAISYVRLKSGVEEQWSELSSNLRRKIKKSGEKGVKVVSGNEELLDDFFPVYKKNINRLGSLTYSYRYFQDLISSFNDQINTVFVAYLDETPIGAAIMVSHGNHFENTYFASLKEYWNTYVSDLLHWEMIKQSISNISGDYDSDPVYSFGRSTINSGVYNYKNHWPVDNDAIYTLSNIEDMKKNVAFLKIWKQLPSFITVPLGGRLIRHLY